MELDNSAKPSEVLGLSLISLVFDSDLKFQGLKVASICCLPHGYLVNP